MAMSGISPNTARAKKLNRYVRLFWIPTLMTCQYFLIVPLAAGNVSLAASGGKVWISFAVPVDDGYGLSDYPLSKQGIERMLTGIL